jgi:hypothetical protein
VDDALRVIRSDCVRERDGDIEEHLQRKAAFGHELVDLDLRNVV